MRSGVSETSVRAAADWPSGAMVAGTHVHCWVGWSWSNSKEAGFRVSRSIPSSIYLGRHSSYGNGQSGKNIAALSITSRPTLWSD